MRILIATGIYPPDIGGPATYTHMIAKKFAAEGHDVFVLSYGDKQASFSEKGVQVSLVSRTSNVLVRYMAYFGQLWRLSKHVDVMYAHDLVSVGLCAALVRSVRSSFRLIIRLGGDFLWEKAYAQSFTTRPLSTYYDSSKNMTERFFMKIYKYVLLKTDHVVFSTSWQQKLYNRFFSVDSSSVIMNAFPDVSPCIYDSSERTSMRRVLFAGRLIELKNITRLCQVVSSIEKVTLDVVGTGPQKDSLSQYIASLPSNVGISFLGYVPHDELLESFCSYDIIVIPSITEVSPHLLLEAIARGIPVLLTKECGLVSAFPTIKTFDPFSDEELRMAIESLVDNATYNAYRIAVQQIPHTRGGNDVVDDHLSLFNKLLA
ncbi:MAG: glycosyltransferase family 4 protein [Candidatus Magasanikbacteria bacterium]|jgi:glycosyltransferase involved in cell wall biosynthesis|nr:glycosyltransferase family 4 protein [Candidatus Magasanikbacteria bacterium]MBT4221225.1 glycosyltransferase family 4 protein [Candidatus Magasanikbacteria bacterium]MBT4350654.1 glycosyltransferase family 4 protein [Candidatus Magasanikbacteria bacterium]MBT4541346.1 glycosyltransferase family 4 protein [Candidatus Magasanikbacteria bacterium]MBT6253080.1 glycosyltransferase family 4 protein [Candidatus Magasanikbacteria bacterium]